MAERTSEPAPDPVDAATRIAAWQSYLIGDTNVLQNVPGITDPDALTVYERQVSADAQTTLLREADRPRTLDLAHLSDVHRRLFQDVYPFAGQLRYVDTALAHRPDYSFVHHPWIDTYVEQVTAQLRAEHNLAHLGDPGQWADRAAYYWQALLHAHPFREGNGRAIRVWLTDLADSAGHALDWARTDGWRNHWVAMVASGEDREPIRALLTVVAGGTVGVDRPITALDDLDGKLERQAWVRTGILVGTDEDKAILPAEGQELDERIANIHRHLAARPVRAATREQPAEERWRGLVASFYPHLVQAERWPAFAAHLDRGAAEGYDMPAELASLGPAAAPDTVDRWLGVEERARQLDPVPPPTLAERFPAHFDRRPPHLPPPSPARGIHF